MPKVNSKVKIGVQSYEQYRKEAELIAQIPNAEFEQFKPEKIILPYGIGIDTHFRFIQVCVLFTTPSAMGLSS